MIFFLRCKRTKKQKIKIKIKDKKTKKITKKHKTKQNLEKYEMLIRFLFIWLYLLPNVDFFGSSAVFK